MNFEKRKIRKRLKKAVPEAKTTSETPETNEANEKTKTKLRISFSIPIIAAVFIIVALFIGIGKAVSDIGVNILLKAAGDELLQDGYGHTNFLILGTGGGEHDGADLTDTIIVASIDPENKLVSMLSIPRDLYVEDSKIGDSRINELYWRAKLYYENSEKGIDHMQTKVEAITGIPIHYWVKIDFDGFKDLIDALGGVDVYVDEAIYDPYYPKDGTIEFEPFYITEGLHHLDGETALKFARSRKTTSDFDRAERQQQIIYAIKEKALKTETILSTEKVKGLLNALKANVETNISVKEILTLGGMADQFSEDSITHRLIHDDPGLCGGLVYPPAREYYNGMFVLIPAGGEEFIHLYSTLNFDHPLIAQENPTIHLLNGTAQVGVAAETKQVLRRFCFDINRFGNADNQDIEETVYYYKEKYDEDGDPIEEKPAALDFLQQIIPGTATTEIPEKYKEYMIEANILVELGNDYVYSNKYLEDAFYNLPMPLFQALPLDDEEDEDTVTTGVDDLATTTETTSATTAASTTTPDASTTE